MKMAIKREKQTTPIGFRIDTELLKDVDKVAAQFKMDRSEIITDALNDFLLDFEEEENDLAVKGFIRGHISASEFKLLTGEKPAKDLEQLRVKFLATYTKDSR